MDTEPVTFPCNQCHQYFPLSSFAPRYVKCKLHTDLTEDCFVCRYFKPGRINRQPRCVSCDNHRLPPPVPAVQSSSPEKIHWMLCRLRDAWHKLGIASRKRNQARKVWARAWTDYTAQLLDATVAHAVAAMVAKTSDPVTYPIIQRYVRVVSDYKLTLPIAEQTDEANEAALELERRFCRMIYLFRNRVRSYIEEEDSYGAGMLGLMEAAKKWNPTRPDMAKFATYAYWLIRRRTQIRQSAQLRPGFRLQDGKCTGVVSLDQELDDKESNSLVDLLAAKPSAELSAELRQALTKLTKRERDLFTRAHVHEVPLSRLAADAGMSKSDVRRQIETARTRLHALLSE